MYIRNQNNRRRSNKKLENPEGQFELSITDEIVLQAQLNNGIVQVRHIANLFILKGVLKGNPKDATELVFDRIFKSGKFAKVKIPGNNKNLGIFKLKSWGKEAEKSTQGNRKYFGE